MRKLILQMQMSVDGFVGSHGQNDWQLWGWGETTSWDEDLKRDFNEHFEAIDTILLSRKMAEEGYLTHWANAAKWHPSDPFYRFAERITDMSKVVPTNKLRASRWERTAVRPGDLRNVVNSLKIEAGSNIGVFGGVGFASALISAGLVDEFQFYVNPTVLGDGVRIFDATGFQKLKLLGSKGYPSGMVVSRYASMS